MASSTQRRQEETESRHVVMIMLDGYRWQELYGGADYRLINSRFVTDSDSVFNKYYRINGTERRRLLMPFLWSVVSKCGSMAGNRWKGNEMQVANHIWKSYAGYNETLCGCTDDEFIYDNRKKYNRNVSILEVLNHTERYRDSISVVTSWDVFPYIFNRKRSGLDVDYKSKDMVSAQVRSDEVTFKKAMTKLKRHPKMLFVSFCETDYYGHVGKYDKYLESAHRSDDYIRQIWEYCQHSPYYKDKTTFIITTDHGRGDSYEHPEEWREHGHNIKGSDETWMIAFGNLVQMNGEMEDGEPVWNRQIAYVIAKIFGIPFITREQKPVRPIDNIFNI